MHRERFLAELRAELQPHLSSHEVESRLAEADAHLNDGINARLELGLSYIEAERETVEEFGKARSISQATLRPLYAPTVAARLRWMAVSYVFLACVYAALDALRDIIPFLAPMIIVIVALCGVRIAILAFRARRAASLPILAAGLAASFGLWTVFGLVWLNLWKYGGMGYVPRWGDHSVLDRAQLEPLRAAFADPIGNWSSQAGSGFVVGLGLAAVYAVIDVAAVGLGMAWLSRRNRNQGGRSLA